MTRLMTDRRLNRTIHLAAAAVLGCYIYWPEFRESGGGAMATQAVMMPLVSLSGLWLWKGKAIAQAIRGDRRPTAPEGVELNA
jgi:hypothetical protein